MFVCVVEMELHDEVVEWMATLDDDQWDRTVVVIDRLAHLSDRAVCPSAAWARDCSNSASHSDQRPEGSPTGSPATGGSSSLAAGNTAAFAALVGHGPTLAAALAIWLTDIAIRAGRLLTTTRSDDHV